MKLFPAIDIKDGQCVRLTQGDFDQKKVYHTDPVVVAREFEEAGSEFLHIVDLDGALEGKPANLELVAAIIESTNLKIQIGGGIRTLDTIRFWLNQGVQRVILGTAALDLKFVEEAVALGGEKICVGVDAKNGKVATHGWETTSDLDAIEFCKELEARGVKTVVFTDISKDGMLQGPNIGIYRELARLTNLDIIASGGVSSLGDLEQLKGLGIYGAITGKAIYEGKFKVGEALACLQNESFPA
ncbi:MAG: 1-(5-phosphoribosyl)-5-[(5-phosphoribosylamino)methylideneamino]imidazole-4-carboxamide isomerase [Turicibacter sp.]|nr:1-(5-phosphoribosyl)-5-[(5-phosphoribosylamino)methylideneamino]imidazole-4-carboxamide isomerase [Turicibacter sp.]